MYENIVFVSTVQPMADTLRPSLAISRSHVNTKCNNIRLLHQKNSVNPLLVFRKPLPEIFTCIRNF